MCALRQSWDTRRNVIRENLLSLVSDPLWNNNIYGRLWPGSKQGQKKSSASAKQKYERSDWGRTLREPVCRLQYDSLKIMFTPDCLSILNKTSI